MSLQKCGIRCRLWRRGVNLHRALLPAMGGIQKLRNSWPVCLLQRFELFVADCVVLFFCSDKKFGNFFKLQKVFCCHWQLESKDTLSIVLRLAVSSKGQAFNGRNHSKMKLLYTTHRAVEDADQYSE